MPADAATPVLSVNIPCYRQPEYARQAIASLLAQTFSSFEVNLLDDGASDEYIEMAASFCDARVRYHRNPARLGAMLNMFAAIGTGRGHYSLAFHEDDLLSREYLSTAVAILERHPECGFVAAELREFAGEPSTEQLNQSGADPEYTLFRSGAEFLRGIFRGIEPMFGSVVYRRSALDGITPEHDTFSTLVDRPFLLSILERWSGAVIRMPQLAWYRRHEDTERHLRMTADHVLRLFERYRETLPAPLSASDKELFYHYSGYWLPTLFDLVPPQGRPSMRRVLLRGLRTNLYDLRWSYRYGRKRLARAVLFPGRIA